MRLRLHSARRSLSADDEDRFVIAQANAQVDEDGKFVKDKVKARFRGEFPIVPPEKVDYMDVSPTQMVSVAASLIPFLDAKNNPTVSGSKNSIIIPSNLNS